MPLEDAGVEQWPVARRRLLTSDSLPPARTEFLDRCGDSLCHHQTAPRCRELKLLLPVYDRSRFQQHRRHARTVQQQILIFGHCRLRDGRHPPAHLAPPSVLRVGFESHEARAIRRTSSMTDAA